MKWAVLVGGTGSNLEAMLKAGAPISLVVSHRAGVRALDIAAQYRVPAITVLPKDFASRTAYDDYLLRLLVDCGIDAVALAGFMRWMGSNIVEAYRGRLVNIHPSLLPAFAGLHAIEQAYDAGVFWTGVTVHFVDEGHDTGPIIAQSVVPRYAQDTVED
ncbi:MAG: phosphoribosylglycinamide formyltransferase, partial [Firmicutes bacterium]|nr:phosphoribosylglycinamide formyltransferase [Bacillota bacterium]